MKKMILIFISTLSFALAQNTDVFNLDDVSTISVKTIWPGVQFFDDYSNYAIKKSEVRIILKSIDDKAAINTFNQGMRMMSGAAVLGYISGFCFGYSITSIIISATNDRNVHYSNYIMLGIGAVSLLSGVMLEIDAKNRIKEGIEMYNDFYVSKNVAENKTKLNFGLTSNGLGFVLIF